MSKQRLRSGMCPAPGHSALVWRQIRRWNDGAAKSNISRWPSDASYLGHFNEHVRSQRVATQLQFRSTLNPGFNQKFPWVWLWGNDFFALATEVFLSRGSKYAVTMSCHRRGFSSSCSRRLIGNQGPSLILRKVRQLVRSLSAFGKRMKNERVPFLPNLSNPVCFQLNP